MAKARHDQVALLALRDRTYHRCRFSLPNDRSDIGCFSLKIARKAPAHALGRVALAAPFARALVEHFDRRRFRNRNGDEFGLPLLRERDGSVEGAVASTA
jgi:hypothetical protein